MAIIVNNPSGTSEDSGLGVIVGVVVGLLLIVLFFVYGLPALQNRQAAAQPDTNITVQLPNPTPAPKPAPAY